MDYNSVALQQYQEARPQRLLCPGPEESLVRNFAIHTLDSCVTVHNSAVQGCEQTGANVMLTFGSEIIVLNGNNLPIQIEALKHVDVFLNRKQAEGLLNQLTKVLNEAER